MRMTALALGLVLTSLAACAAPSGGGSQDASGAGASVVPDFPSQWVFQTVQGQPVQGEQPPSIAFDADGNVSGWAGCNRYNGRAMVLNGTIQFSAMVSTRMACADPALNDQELLVLNAITNAERFAPTDDGLAMFSRRASSPSRLVRAEAPGQ